MPLVKDANQCKGLKEQEISFIQKKSWGASLSWIYFLFNSNLSYFFLSLVLSVIFPINIFMFFYWIIKGRQISWRTKEWNSFDEYNETQTKWDNGAKGYWIFAFVVFIFSILSLLIFMGNNSPANYWSDAKTVSQTEKPDFIGSDLNINVKDIKTIPYEEALKYKDKVCVGPFNDSGGCDEHKGKKVYMLVLNIKNNTDRDFDYSGVGYSEDKIEGAERIMYSTNMYINYTNVFYPTQKQIIIPPKSSKDVAIVFAAPVERTTVFIKHSPIQFWEPKMKIVLPAN
jgi:hypothetical protein